MSSAPPAQVRGVVLCSREAEELGVWVQQVCIKRLSPPLVDMAIEIADENDFANIVERKFLRIPSIPAAAKVEGAAPTPTVDPKTDTSKAPITLVVAVLWDGLNEASKTVFLNLRQLAESAATTTAAAASSAPVLVVQALNAKKGTHTLTQNEDVLVSSFEKKLSSVISGRGEGSNVASESPNKKPRQQVKSAASAPVKPGAVAQVSPHEAPPQRKAAHSDPNSAAPTETIESMKKSHSASSVVAEVITEESLRLKVDEGQGECFQVVCGDTLEAFAQNAAHLMETAKKVKCGVQSLLQEPREVSTETGKQFAMEYIVRRHEEGRHMELRIAMCGNVDSGKSTLTSVLTRGCRDDGRGYARAFIFNYKHEQETGRTSSISENHLGFDSVGNVVNYAMVGAPSFMTDHKMAGNADKATTDAPVAAHSAEHAGSDAATTVPVSHPKARQLSPQELATRSAKVVTLYDLAGHEKYLKTTVLGMTRNMPDYACIVISANNGIQRMTKEHLALCLALKIPFFIVVTRIDATPDTIRQEVLANITKLMKIPSVRKLPYPIRKVDDIIVCAKNLRHDRVAPLFEVSNVAGTGIPELLQFINLLPVRKDWREMKKLPAEMIIDSTFFVTGVGTVVGGIVTQGTMRPNDTVLLGPDGLGAYRPVQIKSIHVKGVDVEEVDAGNDASVCLKKAKRSAIRKGNILAAPQHCPKAYWQFEAEVTVLYHSTTITLNYEPVIHSTTVRQAARITYAAQNVMRTGDRSQVRFHFLYRPEFMKEGQRLIFREGRTKGIGVITRLIEEMDNTDLSLAKIKKREALRQKNSQTQ